MILRERVSRDISTGYRALRRTPGFTATAIVALALGIGLSSAVAVAANTLILRRLPVRDQDRLIMLSGKTRDGRIDNYPLSLGDAREFVRQSKTLEHAAFFTYEGAWPTPVRDGGQMYRLRRALVSGNYFDVLGVTPALGRALTVADDEVGSAPVVVLSYATWTQRFGGDSAVIGRSVVFHESGKSHRIVGVMARGFDYPRGTDVWAAVVPSRMKSAQDSAYVAVDLIGRLARRATMLAATDELSAFFARRGTSTWQQQIQGVAHAFPALVLGDTKPAVLAFAAAAALLLVITCINVANLLLVRGLARRREIAVRSALGASRASIAIQLSVENSMLALAGGLGGAAVCATAIRVFVRLAPPLTPRLDEIGFGWPALASAAAITMLAMCLFSFAPLIAAARGPIYDALRSGTRQTMSRRSRFASEALVGSQVALALMVLSAAALIARSLIALQGAPLHVDGSKLLIGELAIPYERYSDVAKQSTMIEAIVPAIEAVPGVDAASPVVAGPFVQGWTGRPGVDGQSPAQAANNPAVNMEVVSPHYFTALGIRPSRGRVLSDDDRTGAEAVVVVSESMARLYWPGADPVGQHVRMDGDLSRRMTVVGVVPDTRYRDLRDPRPSFYLPLRQSFFPFAPLTLAIRATARPASVRAAIQSAIESAAPGVSLAALSSFDSLLDEPLAQPRVNALLLSVFAGAALVLAAVGLFGVMAAMVRQRVRELGVRMALGATAGNLATMIMRRGMAMTVAGLSVGAVASLAANRLLSGMLFGVAPSDIVAILGAATSLLIVTAVAGFVPARSSMRVDPVLALRSDD